MTRVIWIGSRVQSCRSFQLHWRRSLLVMAPSGSWNPCLTHWKPSVLQAIWMQRVLRGYSSDQGRCGQATGACTAAGNTCTLTAGDPTRDRELQLHRGRRREQDRRRQGTVSARRRDQLPGHVLDAVYRQHPGRRGAGRPGSVFVGWSGDCKGKATCSLQQAYGTLPVTPSSSRRAGSRARRPGRTRPAAARRPRVHRTSQGASVRKTATGRADHCAARRLTPGDGPASDLEGQQADQPGEALRRRPAR